MFQARSLSGSLESRKPQVCAHYVSGSQPALHYQPSWHGLTIQQICTTILSGSRTRETTRWLQERSVVEDPLFDYIRENGSILGTS